MSQSWTTLLTSHTLSDSRSYLNANYESLRSSFSGTSPPTSPSPTAGQLFYNTTENILYVYNGSSWVKLGSMDKNFMGFVPRDDSPNYPMQSNFHMGGHRITNMADPTSDTDGCTLQYARDELIDKHYHSGADNDGPQIKWSDISANNGTASTLELVSGQSNVVARQFDLDSTWGSQSLPKASWLEAATVESYKYANSSAILAFGYETSGTFGAGTHVVRLQRYGATTEKLWEKNLTEETVVFALLDNISASYDYSWKLEFYTNTLGKGVAKVFLLVL